MATIAKNTPMQIERLALGPYETNSYLVICLKTGACAVIDAPGEAGRIQSRLQDLHPQFILMTHNHIDHIAGLAELTSLLRIPVAVHPADAVHLPVSAGRQLHDGDRLSVGTLQLEVLHTPGHTPGSVCFLTDGFLLAGDTLFPGGPGHTRSPADFRQILASITQKLLVLPDHTRIYPGHGEGTILGKEKPAIQRFAARPHAPDLCGDVVWD